MIIAPLVTPIMGIVAAAGVGQPDRIWRCFVVLAPGVLIAITVGWVMGKLMPGGWDASTSNEVLIRTEPRLLDLIIALAAGGAAAFALSRHDVNDSLPGVALSFSLVPPLNTAGILLAYDEGGLARGSLYLFFVNLTAILLAGSIMFLLAGLAREAHRHVTDMRWALTALLVFSLAVAIPLSLDSREFWSDVQKEDDAMEIAQQWFTGAKWQPYEVIVEDNDIEIVVGGWDSLPSGEESLEKLRELIGDDIRLTVRVVGIRDVEFAGPEIDVPGATPIP